MPKHPQDAHAREPVTADTMLYGREKESVWVFAGKRLLPFWVEMGKFLGHSEHVQEPLDGVDVPTVKAQRAGRTGHLVTKGMGPGADGADGAVTLDLETN